MELQSCLELREELFEKLRNKPLYIYGTGSSGEGIYNLLQKKNINIEGFLDSNQELEGSEKNGKKICHPSNVTNLESCNVIIASWFWRDIENLLRSLFPKLAPMFYFHYVTEVDDFFIDESEIPELERLSFVLADNKSQDVLKAILSYRSTLCKDFFNTVFDENQYFGEVTANVDFSHFYDVGAYNGDTVRAVKNNAVTCDTIHSFEPDPKNYAKLFDTIESLSGAFAYNVAVGAKAGSLSFAPAANGYASKASVDGTLNVEIITLDEFIESAKYKPSVIKVDVEGMDLDVLKGGLISIRKYRPSLMISCYHAPRHLHEIPLWIKDNLPDYDIFLRHHRNTSLETVCYAIPR